MKLLVQLASIALVVSPLASAFPAHGSLAGLSQAQLDQILPRLVAAAAEDPPGPLANSSTKLVNDAAHPWQAPTSSDIRGPCPGLNTLASHGYLPRNGIATPAQIINAIQEGFNMENSLAKFVTYAAFLVDGNLVTNLLSIGGKSPLTGEDPPAPAIVGGLNTHAVFEGDSSMTRADAFFGDNHSFNQTLWNQFVDFSNRYGGGFYDINAAAELRFQRIQESIATNPEFSFISPRYFTAYAESVFPINFFIDGRQTNKKLSLSAAESFFKNMKFPDDFWRPPKPTGVTGLETVIIRHLVSPGGNQGRINSYTPDPNSANILQLCKLYQDFVNNIVKAQLYPNPTGELKDALNRNLGFLYEFVKSSDCAQVFPYGQ